MKWSMDTHKYISEITRKALQVMTEHGITSESEPKEIDAVERELGSCGVYKDYESAKGRVRRALFTYFKAYGCLNDSEQLTEIGRLYAENKLTIQEFSFYYILNYIYENDAVKYYPAELVLWCFYKLYERSEAEAYLSPYDFSKIVECASLEDIDDDFIDGLIAARENAPIAVNERTVGYDVWAKMFIQAGIFRRNADRNLITDNIMLIKWILEAYQHHFDTHMGTVCTGVLKYFPIMTLNSPNGDAREFSNEGKALQAYLFEGIKDAIIDKYIMVREGNSCEQMRLALGLIENNRGFFDIFIGLERLIGHCLANNNHPQVKIIGEILASMLLTEEQVLESLRKELRADYDTTNRLITGCNVLLYGVPGSGKSWTIGHEYCKPGNVVERLVFHPDYTYSDFIGQILPAVAEDGQVSYKFTPGPFTNILREAYNHPGTEYILIIEEINRGNAPAIFGEVFQLLDRKVEIRDIDDDGFPVGTSEYGITNMNIAEEMYGKDRKTEKVRIPSNLSIIGTMNTSDQNVFTLDTAFQRRWDMRLIENDFANVDSTFANAAILDTTVTWKNFCVAINKIVVGNSARMTSAEDKRLGAYFVHLRDLKFNDAMGALKEYDALRKKESEGTLTQEEKTQIAVIRDAIRQNRKFPEKVIKYLWDDAFKFNREVIFEVTEYQSLEQVIRAFMYAQGLDRFKVFKDNVKSAFIGAEEE